MTTKNLLLITAVLLTGLISGCASNLPVEITTPITGSPLISEVLQATEIYQGKSVRWGGSIASIENKKDETWIEIVSRELNRNGRPKKSVNKTAGRFLAKVDQFLDPEIYIKGRLITIVGELAGSQGGKIGDQPYKFPIVHSKTAYLWTEYPDPPRYPHYGRPYYDPYWDPYWSRHWHHRFFYRDPYFWY